MELAKPQWETGKRISVGIPVFEPENIPVDVDPCKGGWSAACR